MRRSQVSWLAWRAHAPNRRRLARQLTTSLATTARRPPSFSLLAVATAAIAATPLLHAEQLDSGNASELKSGDDGWRHRWGELESELAQLGKRGKALGEAGVRILRLVATVSLIVADYKAYEALRAAGLVVPTESEALHEGLHRVLRAAQDAQKAATTLEESAAAHDAVMVAARALADAEADGARSPLSPVHQRAAEALLRLCRSNGGIYIKLGQTVSTLDLLVPPEYVSTLRAMLDQAPTSSAEDVRRVVSEELGRPPEEVWDEFDPSPIASASLAQVHVAKERGTGRKLAIKIQHRGLRETAAGDIEAVKIIVTAIAKAFPQLQFEWLAEELAKGLPQELDFVNEGRNAERCASLLCSGSGGGDGSSGGPAGSNGGSGGGGASYCSSNDEVIVPSIFWESTTPRVLTMSFEGGVRATDAAEMRRLGVRLPRVAALISRTFCAQIFRHGFVHCDPHGANLLVRPHPAGGKRPQLVLLDHGLYRELDRDFRLDYNRLWKALITADLPGVEKFCRKLGAGDMYPLLAAMLTSRPWDDISGGVLDLPAGGGGGGGAAKADAIMVQGYAHNYMGEISDMLARVPRPLILLFKTNDCLRHIDRCLGAPINTFVITARAVSEVLLHEAWQEAADAATTDREVGFARRWLRRLRRLFCLLEDALKMLLFLAVLSIEERRLERLAEAAAAAAEKQQQEKEVQDLEKLAI